VVAEKLQTITTLLHNLGQWCTTYGLKERDLPQTLRRIFQNFESGLSGVRRELEQIKKAKSAVKRIMLHKDTAQRVKQCDDKLSNLLQTFEVALTADTRLKLEQISGSIDSLRLDGHRGQAQSLQQLE